MNKQKAIKASLTAFGATALAVGMVPNVASANSDSGRYNYTSDGSEWLEADVWLSSVSDWHNCGQFQTKAYLHGNNPATADWIRDTTKFHGIGGSVTVAESVGSTKDDSQEFYWQNSNAYEADLAGSICGSYTTLYTEGWAIATASVPKYGSVRTAEAHV